MTSKQLKVLNRMHGLSGKPLNCFIHNGNTYCVCDYYAVMFYGENKELVEQYPSHSKERNEIVLGLMAGLKDCHSMMLPPEKEIREWCKKNDSTRKNPTFPLRVRDKYNRTVGFNPWYVIDAYDVLKIGRAPVDVYIESAIKPAFFMSDEGLFMLMTVRLSNPFRWNYGPDGWEE